MRRISASRSAPGRHLEAHAREEHAAAWHRPRGRARPPTPRSRTTSRPTSRMPTIFQVRRPKRSSWPSCAPAVAARDAAAHHRLALRGLEHAALRDAAPLRGRRARSAPRRARARSRGRRSPCGRTAAPPAPATPAARPRRSCATPSKKRSAWWASSGTALEPSLSEPLRSTIRLSGEPVETSVRRMLETRPRKSVVAITTSAITATVSAVRRRRCTRLRSG